MAPSHSQIGGGKRGGGVKSISGVGPHLVLLGPVLHRVTVVEVGGGAAGGAPPAPALLLHPGTAVGVDLAAD